MIHRLKRSKRAQERRKGRTRQTVKSELKSGSKAKSERNKGISEPVRYLPSQKTGFLAKHRGIA